MKNQIRLLALGVGLMLWVAGTASSAQQPTFQGRLMVSNNPANGQFVMRFKLRDGPSDTNVVLSTSTQTVAVVDGLFATPFLAPSGPVSALFTGDDRWLEIGVAPLNNSNVFSVLSPRQKVAPAPESLYATKAGSLSDGALSPAMVSTNGATAGQSLVFDGTNITWAVSAVTASCSTYANCYWTLLGNSGTTPDVNFLGTTDYKGLELRVNNQRALRIEPTLVSPNIIAGASANSVNILNVGATLSGGGSASSPNIIGGTFQTPPPPDSSFATISGGVANQVMGYGSTVGGGVANIISVTSPPARFGTIAGGQNNFIQAGDYQTIGGGTENVVRSNANYATISGGSENYIGYNGNGSTIAGGEANTIDPTIPNSAGFAPLAFIGGGTHNRIGAATIQTVIGGGGFNLVGWGGTNATIGGGTNNQIWGFSSGATIGGGISNIIPSFASGATIPGGSYNRATTNSFAAGQRAKADHTGAFVWADSTAADFASTAPNQFWARATGGVRFLGGANGVTAEGNSATATALRISNGGIRVTGAGVATATPVFVHKVTAANIEAGATHRTTIDHVLSNGDPNAILLITSNNNPGGGSGVSDTHPLGVFYNATLLKWQIYHQDSVAMTVNAAYNVLIVKP